METQISQEDLKQIEAGIRNKYSKVADSPQGQFKYPTGRAGLETLKYDAALIEEIVFADAQLVYDFFSMIHAFEKRDEFNMMEAQWQ